MRNLYIIPFFLILSLGCRAQNSRGQALIIGNQHYAKGPLRTAVNDAGALASTLNGLGFEVTRVTDATLAEMASKIDWFSRALNGKGIVLVYYSGHGLQIDGQNYLLPIDFTATNESEAKHGAYALSRIIEKISVKRVRLKIVILDSCRDNPFFSAVTVHPGWAAMTSSSDTLIAFATQPGRTANDNPSDANSLFAKHLLAEIGGHRTSLQALFARVSHDVYFDSNRSQLPWTAPQRP